MAARNCRRACWARSRIACAANHAVERLALGIARLDALSVGPIGKRRGAGAERPDGGTPAALAAPGARDAVGGLLGVREIFPAALAADVRFADAVRRAYDALGGQGALAAARRYAASLATAPARGTVDAAGRPVPVRVGGARVRRGMENDAAGYRKRSTSLRLCLSSARMSPIR